MRATCNPRAAETLPSEGKHVRSSGWNTSSPSGWSSNPFGDCSPSSATNWLRAAWCTEGRRETPQGNERKAPFGELVVTGRRQMAARTDCGRTLARSHGHFDTLLVGTEVGVLVDKTSETMAAV